MALAHSLCIARLLNDENEVDIRFTGTYRKDGNGLHHSIDPDDGETYMYTQFESFHANKCFPCFDQPDIKAAMKLRTFSPGDWKVITNEFETDVTNSSELYGKFLSNIGCPNDVKDRFTEEDNFVFRQFKETDKISAYLYAFVVGPYVYESNRCEGYEKYVPMRVMARKSVMKYVTVEEFFKLTMAGMDYYAEFFGQKYPFTKYDQIFVPEFNMGAMENVGCVTFTESYLYRGKVIPQSKKENLAITILHELAHMWFGNLVTMKWWDDLWLNESFATFMSHMALANAKGLEDYTLSWEIFIGDKTWGMKTDQFATTHPIAANCETTEDAENIFDGISYGKGSAFLKQLVAFLSEEAFRGGLKSYFKKYAYQNTELVDFIAEMQSACDDLSLTINVQKWCDSWIKTSGFNVIESELQISEGELPVVTGFKVFQSLSEHGENCLREQKVQVALFNDAFEIYEVVDIKIDAQEVTEVKELDGKIPPKAYLVNYGDWGYGKFLIDERSLEAFKEGLQHVQDNLSRKLIHNTIYIMVRDAKMSADMFIKIIMNQIINESNQEIVQDQVFYNMMVTLQFYVPSTHREKEKEKVFNFLMNEFMPKAVNGELKQIILSAAIAISCNEEQYALMKQWLVDGKITSSNDNTEIEDVSITPENKYAILRKIATSTKMNQKDIKEFYTSQLENDDNKDLAHRCKLSCEAAEYNKDVKEKMWQKITQDKCELSIYDQQAIMRTLMPVNQRDIVQPYIDGFFEVIPRLFKSRQRGNTLLRNQLTVL